MASGSSSDMQAPTVVRLVPNLQSSEGDGGSRLGETIATGTMILQPRSESRPFASPLYRKAYLMRPAVDVQLELQDNKPCV